MPELRRMSDGAGDCGARVEAIEWNEDGTFKEIKGHRPIVGCSLLVGSVTARSYSNQDWWLTTPITEILEEEERKGGEDEGYYCKFKTGNSIYEFWAGNTGLWAKTVKKIKNLHNDKECKTCKYFDSKKTGCKHPNWDSCIKRDENEFVIDYEFYTKNESGKSD